MNEGNVSKEIMLIVGKSAPETRMFRNNTGTAYQGEIIHKDGHTITLANPRIIHMGLCEGSSDYIGWTELQVTPDMIGKKVAIFTGIEIKTERGIVKEKQANFIKRILEAGGKAGVARNGQQAVAIIKNP